MEQTAVEWLFDQVHTVKWKFADVTDRKAIFERAKEMEKQQCNKKKDESGKEQTPRDND